MDHTTSSSAEPSIQICIVTGQPQANLIPILLYKPERAVLVITPGMKAQQRGDQFAEVVSKLELVAPNAIEQVDFPDQNYLQMEDAACEVLGRLLEQYPDHRILLNATGGTKLISQAWVKALEVGDEARCGALYLDTQHNAIERLQPKQPAEPVPDVLTIEHALKAQGFTQRKTQSTDDHWRGASETRRALTLSLGREAAGLDWLFSEMNSALHTFDDKHPPASPVSLRKLRVDQGQNGRMLRKLHEAGLIDLAEGQEPAQFYVKDIDALRYLTGGWIEELVYLTLVEAGVRQVLCGMEQTSDIRRQANIRNELDVVAVHQNRLLIIECKTANLVGENEYNAVLHKLNSLGEQTGGSLGQKWLVLGRMPVSGRDADERDRSRETMTLRAASMNITLITPEDLPTLRDRVNKWMGR